jgi:acyl carrier protein
MSVASHTAIRLFILEHVQDSLAAKGLTPPETPDDFDLLAEGMIDSFGLVELIDDVEKHFGVTLDLEALDPDEITVVGPLTAYVASIVEQRR